MQHNKILSSIIIVIFFLLPSCKKKVEMTTEEIKESESILQDANILWLAGSELDALKRYQDLAKKYPESEARKTAEIRLQREGISIEKALISWTIKRMIEMENQISQTLYTSGSHALDDTFGATFDAWGQALYFKVYSIKKEYDFIVFSFGPDAIKGTDDDLAVVHYREKKGSINNYNPDIYSSEQGENQSHPSSGEQNLSLDELKSSEFGLNSSNGEMSLSFNELAESSKNENFNEGSNEESISLDDLAASFGKD